MTKLYVVTFGDCQSNVEFDSIWSLEELAKKYIDMLDDDHTRPCIDVFQLDPETEIVKRGYGYWCVHMARDGEVISTMVDQDEPDNFDPERAKVYRVGPPFNEWTEPKFLDALRCSMKAHNKEHAVKIANERRTAILAAHQWPDDPPVED